MIVQNPFIKLKNNHVPTVMADVIIALLPLAVVACLAYGVTALQLMVVSVATAALTEFIFSALFFRNYKSVSDGSAVVTGLLLSLVVSPLTPWYIVAFGSFAAILFGKICCGGLGTNRFNPALLGREFMSVFFPAIMGAASIWATNSMVNVPAAKFFPGLEYDHLNVYLSSLIYKTKGAMGEYSALAILAGGLYLLIRKRISWHIPTATITVFTLAFWFTKDGGELNYSLSGLMLGAIFMATDMPTSPVNSIGKLYYGAMIGLLCFLFILGDVRSEYLSYSILILNGFSPAISRVFRPVSWGEQPERKKQLEQAFLLTLAILTVFLALLNLHYFRLIQFLIYAYLLYLVFRFNFQFRKKITNLI